MKVLILNGSPNKNGTTMRAIEEVDKTLQKNGIETEIVNVGSLDVMGCIDCGACKKLGKCFRDDIVNELIEKVNLADGIIVGSPVYYAGINGTLKSLLDRLFTCGKGFRGKPAASISVARRAGNTFTLDTINKYFMIREMYVVSSQYWNMVFGASANDAEKDLEGLQTMRTLGNNMAYILKAFDLAKKNGLEFPTKESAMKTNFIR